MKSKQVTLKDGIELTVYRPPTRLYSIAKRMYPEPEAPIVETKTASGSVMQMQIVDDPSYLKAKVDNDRLISDKLVELESLSALRDVEVPDDFDMMAEVGEVMQYADPDWKPREGEAGRKLDYIEWMLLADIDDANIVTIAIAELSGIDLEEITRVEESFRDNMEGQTAKSLEAES